MPKSFLGVIKSSKPEDYKIKEIKRKCFTHEQTIGGQVATKKYHEYLSQTDRNGNSALHILTRTTLKKPYSHLPLQPNEA